MERVCATGKVGVVMLSNPSVGVSWEVCVMKPNPSVGVSWKVCVTKPNPSVGVS